MAAEVKRQDVQTQAVQRGQQAGDVAAVPSVAVTEEDVAPRLGMRHPPAGQVDAVRRLETDLFESQVERRWVPLGHGV